MIYYAPFKVGHIYQIQLQLAQEWVRDYFYTFDMKVLESDYASTIFRDGNPIACGGCVPFGDGRGYVWSLVSDEIGKKDFVQVHRITKMLLEQFPYRRLESYVDCEFEAGHRWMKALGFEMECSRMRKFQQNGSDSALYAKVT